MTNRYFIQRVRETSLSLAFEPATDDDRERGIGGNRGRTTIYSAYPSNAFDTASLLIALLRAAEIPARYRYGTVRIPESQARNWLVNLRSPRAALNLLAQGGIPTFGFLVVAAFLGFILVRYLECANMSLKSSSRARENDRGNEAAGSPP